MRLSRFALYLGILGVLGSILMVVFTQVVPWKMLHSDGLNLLQFSGAGLNLLAFVLALIALAMERDSAAGTIALRCFVFLLVAAAASVFGLFMEIARHPV